MPFCDKSHRYADWDSTETADTGSTAERQEIYAGGTKIVVKRDHSLCMESGFCGTRLTNIKRMVAQTDDTQVRSLVMAMIERCPSGSYSYAIEEGGPDIEPDLPQEIAVVTEITSDGPITGPYWVTATSRSSAPTGSRWRRVTASCCAAAGSRRSSRCATARTGGRGDRDRDGDRDRG